METYFAVHLDGLTLVPSEIDSALEFLDILDEQIRDVDMMNMSPNTLIGVWILIKKTLAWLSKMDTANVMSQSRIDQSIHTDYDIE